MRYRDGHRSSGLACLAVLVAALVALAGTASAQVLYGSVVGNVLDPTQAPVPGATVTIINAGTNLARETTTRNDGSYSFVNVIPGNYRVRVVLTGFKEYVKEGVPISPNAVARVDVTLEVGAMTEVVNVQSETRLLQTDSGSVQSELKSKEVESLPLGNYRNYQELLNLVPGTTPAGFQNAITDTPARSLTTNVNGTARNNNNTRLDGAVTVFVWLPHHAVYVAPADTVDTVNVSTSNFDAEQGLAGGAAVTVLTKSGTNEFHGSGSWLFENSDLRARNWANPAPNEKPKSKRNIGTVTLGGPILKNKLFFFGAWEGHYAPSPSTITGTVPTEAMRNGDFSAFGTTIYNPFTGNADGTGRTPFANNIIPASLISPIAQSIQSRIPMPNKDGTSDNYTASGLVTFNRNNYDFKVNWNASSNAQIFAKYSLMKAHVYSDMWLGNPPQGGAGGSGFGVGSGNGDTKVQVGTLGYSWTVSPSFILDGNFSFARFDQTCFPPDYGTNYGTDVFGIPGTNGEGGGNGDIRYSGMPYFSIANFSGIGGVDAWTPLFRNDRTYNLSLNGTYVKSSHEMRFGLDIVKMELNHWQPELGYPRGYFYFGGGATTLAPSGSPNEYNSYAQFLLGLTSSVEKSIQYQLSTGREWMYSAFFRDRWQVNKKLTLNLGLRYEIYPLMQRQDRGIEEYVPSTNQVLLCGLGGNPTDCGIKVKYPHLLPRLGFDYRLTDNDVVRGGYGITVSPMPFSRPLRSFYPNVVANNYPSTTAYIPYGSLASGIPLFYGPDLSSGSITLPPNSGMGSPGTSVNRPYIQSWNVTYERRLPWDMSVSMGYVGTKTTHQLGFQDINASDAGQGQAGQPLYQLWGRTAFTWLFDGWLSSNYHSLQVALNKPFSRGLFVKAAYTYSKAMNRVDDDGWANASWNSADLLYKNYGPAGYDRTHIFQLGFVADLPLAKKGGSGAANAILRDWSLNGLFSAFTGTPFTVTAPGASVNARGNQQTADLVGTINKLGGIGSGNPYYDPSAWAAVTGVVFGNTGRNTVRGPGWWNIDMSLFRRFPIAKKVTLEARIEAFNLTNTPHFTNPNGDVSSGGFMTITGTSANSPERQFRVGARLQF